MAENEAITTKPSLAQTASAVILYILLFTFTSMIVAPVLVSITDFFGEHFLPERMGGGSSYTDPGLFESIRRAGIITLISGYASYLGTTKVLPKTAARQYISISTFLLVLAFCSLLIFGKRKEVIPVPEPAPRVEAPLPGK